MKEGYVDGNKLDLGTGLDFDFLQNGTVIIANGESEMSFTVQRDHIEIERASGAIWLAGTISFNSERMIIEGKNDVNADVRMIFSRPDDAAQDDYLPRFMRKSGWVTFSEVCESGKERGLSDYRNADCSEGTTVTDKSTPLNAIYWAGEVVEMYFDKSTNEFSRLKVRVTWYSPRSKYECGQIIHKGPSEVKDFTHTSLALRKCE